MAISDGDYNKARAILVDAKSLTAQKSHIKHTKGKGSKLTDGRQLIEEARAEFVARKAPGQADITPEEQKALQKAAAAMGL